MLARFQTRFRQRNVKMMCKCITLLDHTTKLPIPSSCQLRITQMNNSLIHSLCLTAPTLLLSPPHQCNGRRPVRNLSFLNVQSPFTNLPLRPNNTLHHSNAMAGEYWSTTIQWSLVSPHFWILTPQTNGSYVYDKLFNCATSTLTLILMTNAHFFDCD